METRILLFAKHGQLGWELHRTLLPLDDVFALQTSEVNFEDIDSVLGIIKQVKPGLIVNPAAYTNVDLAEKETDSAGLVNGIVPGVIAEEAKKIGSVLIHFSTDYVFDGRKDKSYVETDAVGPINFYGKSKLDGEQAIQSVGDSYLIFRTSWVYSLRQQGGFVNKVLQWSRKQTSLKVVTDQVANPTWARMLAEVIAQIVGRGKEYLVERTGLYHLAGGGYASRFDWAKSILDFDPDKDEQIVKELLPALTTDFPSPAERPLFSALDCTKFEDTFNLKLPDWNTALRLAMG